MKRIEIEGTDTVIVLKKGNIENETTDVIMNWVNSDLRSGPRSFYAIHQKAGPQLFNHTIGFEGVGDADAFSTMPAQLDCRLVIHAVIPRSNAAYIKAFYNVGETLKKYMEKNLVRTMTLFIPGHPDECLAGVKTFLLDKGLKEVVIMYLTENEYQTIQEFYKPLRKKYSVWRRMDKRIISGLITLYTWTSATVGKWKAARLRGRRS